MALGSIVDAALSRVLKDILALSDIPEVESHKLSELCRILHALESLFVEDSNHVCHSSIVLLLSILKNPPAIIRCCLCTLVVEVLIPFGTIGQYSRAFTHDLLCSHHVQEASIADISYLFEEKALVDFEIEELVKLVKALFADTSLRANTINKLMQGHHVS